MPIRAVNTCFIHLQWQYTMLYGDYIKHVFFDMTCLDVLKKRSRYLHFADVCRLINSHFNVLTYI